MNNPVVDVEKKPESLFDLALSRLENTITKSEFNLGSYQELMFRLGVPDPQSSILSPHAAPPPRDTAGQSHAILPRIEYLTSVLESINEKNNEVISYLNTLL